MSRARPRFTRANPALPAAPANTFEVIMIGFVEGQETINTFYYADGGAALTAGTEASIATSWDTLIGPTIRAAISSDWLQTQIKVQCLTSPNRQPATVNAAHAGTGSAGHEPTTVGLTLIRKSAVKGQAGRGRVSLPAVPATFVLNSQVSAFGVAAVSAAAAELGVGFVSGGITYVAGVVSRKNKAGPALGFSPVVATTYNPIIGSARRRKLGRGV